MSKLRLAASAVVTVLLLALCAVLAAPAFQLPATSYQGGIGAGGLPQFTVLAVGILTPIMLIQDFLAYRRRAPEPGSPADARQARRTLVLGGIVFALLAAFVAAWQELSFLPAAIGFTAAMCAVLMPKERRTPAGYVVALAFSGVFCTGVWAVFVHLLAVPLR